MTTLTRCSVLVLVLTAAAARAAEPAPAAKEAPKTEPAKAVAASATPAVASTPAAASATGAVASAPKPAEAKKEGIKGTVPAGQLKTADYPDNASFPMQGAIRSALAKVQGKVLSLELEAVDGFLVYEIVVVKSDHSILTVLVDAGNGKALSVAPYQPD